MLKASSITFCTELLIDLPTQNNRAHFAEPSPDPRCDKGLFGARTTRPGVTSSFESVEIRSSGDLTQRAGNWWAGSRRNPNRRLRKLFCRPPLLNGTFWVLRSGALWRNPPPQPPCYNPSFRQKSAPLPSKRPEL